MYIISYMSLYYTIQVNETLNRADSRQRRLFIQNTKLINAIGRMVGTGVSPSVARRTIMYEL